MTSPSPAAPRRSICACLAVGAAAFVLVCVATGCGSDSGAEGSTAQRRLAAAQSTAVPLALVTAPTPRLRVARYDTSGTLAQVRGGNLDLRKVNAALRAAVLADQREFAPFARRGAIGTAKRYRGVYRTVVDRRFASASTVVVSALMPAIEQFPGGSLGNGWVAATVRVPSGTPVAISDLFADPSRGVRVLAAEWKTRFRRASPDAWPCVRLHPSSYRPVPRNYRHFALTPRGVVVGFWQEAACNRLQATVPYSVLRPYLSGLGSRLIAGVRPPS
jgi:hypothetical protein